MAFSNPVTRQQAQQIAAKFKTAKSKGRRAPSASEMRSQVVMDAVNQQGEPYLYAVTFGDLGGYVIVSGDDRFREVLGYSDSGDFSNQDMPCNMRAWLQDYVEEMKHLDAIAYQPSTSASNRASAIKSAISPLIETQWNQNAPYNDKCKEYFVYHDAVTGCVATAMAQVMYYHAVRKGIATTTLSTEIPAYTTGRGYAVPVVPVGTEIKWSDMSDLTTSAGQDAVSTLMLCCGVSVEMNYANSASGGSGASSTKIPPALKKYFGFSPATRRIERASYSLKEWTDLVYSELSAGRPLLYGGQSSGGGHEFVVDGYDGDELFHVNWGWSGSNDGYYALSVMNPGDNSGIGASTSNDGYTYDQDIIVGADLDSGEEMLTMSTASLSVSGTTVKWGTYNRTGEENTFDIGLGFIDEGGNIDVIVNYSNKTLSYLSGYSSLSYTMSNNSSFAGQTKKIVPISKLSSSSQWLTDLDPNYRYVEAVYDGSGNVTLTAHPVENLEITEIDFPGSKYMNEAQQVEVTIHNSGDEFYGNSSLKIQFTAYRLCRAAKEFFENVIN